LTPTMAIIKHPGYKLYIVISNILLDIKIPNDHNHKAIQDPRAVLPGWITTQQLAGSLTNSTKPSRARLRSSSAAPEVTRSRADGKEPRRADLGAAKLVQITPGKDGLYRGDIYTQYST
jgi:hypothetical protein